MAVIIGGHINIGLPISYIYALAIDPVTPDTFMRGLTMTEYLRSVNGGGSWTPAKTGLTDSYVKALVLDPQTPSNLFAGTYGGGVFKSIDSAVNWSPSNNELVNTDIISLALDPVTPQSCTAAQKGVGYSKAAMVAGAGAQAAPVSPGAGFSPWQSIR